MVFNYLTAQENVHYLRHAALSCSSNGTLLSSVHCRYRRMCPRDDVAETAKMKTGRGLVLALRLLSDTGKQAW